MSGLQDGDAVTPVVDTAAAPVVDTASAAAEVVESAEEVDAALRAGPAEAPLGGVKALYARFRHLIHELGKFGTVGACAFVVDVTIFNVLRRVGDVEPLLSATTSMVIAATLAFIGNRFWTWRDRERSGLHREYSLYFIFNLVGLLIALACLGISTYGLGSIWPVFKGAVAENVAKNLVGTALGTTFRFWSYRSIVFRSTS